MIPVKTAKGTYKVGGGVINPQCTSFPRKDSLVGPKRGQRREIARKQNRGKSPQEV